MAPQIESRRSLLTARNSDSCSPMQGGEAKEDARDVLRERERESEREREKRRERREGEEIVRRSLCATTLTFQHRHHDDGNLDSQDVTEPDARSRQLRHTTPRPRQASTQSCIAVFTLLLAGHFCYAQGTDGLYCAAGRASCQTYGDLGSYMTSGGGMCGSEAAVVAFAVPGAKYNPL